MSVFTKLLCARLLALCLLLASAAALAVSPAPLPSSTTSGRVDLTPYVALLEDPTGSLTVGDVRSRFAAGAVTPAAASGISLGLSSSAWWIGFSIPAHTTARQAEQMLLELGFPTLDRIDYYAPGSQTPVTTGDVFPFAQRPVDHRNFVFALEPGQEGPSLVLLRLASEGSLSVPLALWTPAAFAHHSYVSYAGFAAYFGALLALLAYNALLWTSIRERVYLDYVLFVSGLGIGLAGFNGMGNAFVWSGWPWFANLAYPLGFALASYGIAQFTRSFLLPKPVSARLDLALRATSALAVVTAIVQSVFSYALGAKMMTLLTILASSLAVWTAFFCMVRKVRAARLYLLAWSQFLLFGIVFALRTPGLVPANFLTLHGLELGSLLGMLLLSYALADRIQTERRDKETAQAQTLEARQANIEQLQRSEHELEARVTARTTELAAANARLLQSEQQQRELAQHDMLTGLANRALFSDRLQHALAIAKRDGTRFALLYLDLDKFKPVNDTHGHAVGDLLLKEVAQRMTRRVRESDTVARIGGDEFVVILRAIDGDQSVIQVAQSILEALGQPFLIGELSLQISCCIGAAIYPDHGDDELTLSRVADGAMYQAKHSGRNRVCLAQNAG
jgi:diguanylate cyclase (GGDEF)-like protein